jgi:hypothetical protein
VVQPNKREPIACRDPPEAQADFDDDQDQDDLTAGA